MAKYNLRRSMGVSRGPHAGILYGPGEAVEVPDSVAMAVGLMGPNGEVAESAQSKPASAEGGEDGEDGEDKGEADDIFASPAAKKAAEDAELTPADFEGRKASGADGKFTKADVTDFVAEREGGGEADDQ